MQSLETETEILRDRDETWDLRDRDSKKTGLETHLETETKSRDSISLIPSCSTTDIRLFDFYGKGGLGPDQSRYDQVRLWSRLQTKLAQIKRIVQVNIHCFQNFFTMHDFWATCACPEKSELPWHFWLFNILFTFRIFNNLRLAWKQFHLKFFTVMNIFFTIQDFWATLRLPWKTEGALNSLYWICIFYYSGFLSNLHLPWKIELPWIF